MKTIFLCFFCLFTIGCTHQSSQENCVEIGSADSICLQKELYTLHKYVDSIIKIDTILQQRFHCFGAGLTKDKVSIDFQDIWKILLSLFNRHSRKKLLTLHYWSST